MTDRPTRDAAPRTPEDRDDADASRPSAVRGGAGSPCIEPRPGDPSRRVALGGLLAGTVGAATGLRSGVARAQAGDWPNRSIRIVVPYAPGGGTDLTARLMATRLSATFGQPVVVENRPGASANIGTEVVARAPADGYTVLVTAPNFATSEALFEKLSWTMKDFAPVMQLVRYPNVLVAGPNAPYPDLRTLLARAKAAPGTISYGSAGTASMAHLGTELLGLRAGVKLQHVPYKGSGPLKVDLMGGHVPLAADGLSSQIEAIRAGSIKALAVLAPKRWPAAPDIPGLADFGIDDVDGTGWYGALVPAKTPPEIVAKLHDALAAALQAPEVRERIGTLGLEAVGGTSEAFGRFLEGEGRKWADVIRTGQIRSE